MQENLQQPSLNTEIKTKMSSPLELLQKSINFYKIAFWKFIGMSAIGIVAVLFLVAVIALEEFLSSVNAGSIPLNILFTILVIIGMVLVVYVVFVSLSGTYLLFKNFSAEQKAVEAIKFSFLEGKNYAGALLFLGFITSMLVFLWTLLLIIPGVIFAIYYFFAVWVLFFENIKGMQAIKRSKELVTNYWFAVFGRIAFMYIFYYIVIIVVTMPSVIAGEESMLGIVFSIIAGAVQFCLAPLLIIYSYFMYRDLSKIKGATKIA
jgi:hypothetical protein